MRFRGGWNKAVAAVMENKRQIKKKFQSCQIFMMLWGGEERRREMSRIILQVSGMAAWIECWIESEQDQDRGMRREWGTDDKFSLEPAEFELLWDIQMGR